MTNGSLLKWRIPFLDQLLLVKIRSKTFIILCTVISVVLILFTYFYTIPLYDNTEVRSYVFKAGYDSVRYEGSGNEPLVKKSECSASKEIKELREIIEIDIVEVKPLDLKDEETIKVASENENLKQVDTEHDNDKTDYKDDEEEDYKVNDDDVEKDDIDDDDELEDDDYVYDDENDVDGDDDSGNDENYVDGDVVDDNNDGDDNVMDNNEHDVVANDESDNDDVGPVPENGGNIAINDKSQQDNDKNVVADDDADNETANYDGDNVVSNDENDDDIKTVGDGDDVEADDDVVDNYDESDEYSIETVSEVPKQSNISNVRINSLKAGFQWNDTRLDILHMRKPRYDKKFKNPCWYEQLDTPSPYKGNVYATISPSAKTVLGKLTDVWEDIYSNDEPNYRLRCLPYFMIIGQPKCGTTDLFWKIAKHADINTPPIKELHWWSRSRQGRRFSYSKIIPFEDYVDMFDAPAVNIEERFNNITDDDNDYVHNNDGRNQIIVGEASVSLFWDNTEWKYFPENEGQSEPLYIIPHYIHHIMPQVKLILMLRDPVERMYSDYLYFHSIDKSADDFHEAVVQATDLYNKCFITYSVRKCVYDTNLANKVRIRLRIGIYSAYLKDWLKLFPLSQFYILRLEDYSKYQVDILKQIYKFLDMRELSSMEKQRIQVSPMSNVRKDEDKQLGGMYEKTRKLLHQFYKPFNIELANILNDKRYLWTDV